MTFCILASVMLPCNYKDVNKYIHLSIHVSITNSVLCSGNGFNCYRLSDEPPYYESVFIRSQPVPYI